MKKIVKVDYTDLKINFKDFDFNYHNQDFWQKYIVDSNTFEKFFYDSFITLTLNFDFAVSLNKNDVIKAKCFKSTDDVGKDLIEFYDYFDIYFILKYKVYQTENHIMLDFKMLENDDYFEERETF